MGSATIKKTNYKLSLSAVYCENVLLQHCSWCKSSGLTAYKNAACSLEQRQVTVLKSGDEHVIAFHLFQKLKFQDQRLTRLAC